MADGVSAARIKEGRLVNGELNAGGPKWGIVTTGKKPAIPEYRLSHISSMGIAFVARASMEGGKGGPSVKEEPGTALPRTGSRVQG
jgi:hypothetical protein